MPPCLQDWLPENHLARFVADVVRQLDLREIYDHYERKDGRGLAAYHPEMLTRLLLYGYAIGESSSRRIEQATYDDVAFRYLAADQHPDHDTIASFRQQHRMGAGKSRLEARHAIAATSPIPEHPPKNDLWSRFMIGSVLRDCPMRQQQ